MYDINVQTLMTLNEIASPQDLKEGRLLYISGQAKELPYEVKNNSVLQKQAVNNDSAILKNEFVWPLRGRILTKFGKNEKHRYDGINIEGKWGSEIRAISDGKVMYSGDGVKGYGNMVIVKHQDRFYSIYALNSENLVSVGDLVKKSQVIAKVGGIPRIGKSFLHFQLRNGKKAIDPLTILK